MQSQVAKKRSVYATLSLYFLDNFALALVYPIFTPLLFHKHSEFLVGIDSGRIAYLGFLIAAFPIAQFFGSPVIGGIADRYGRKKAFYWTLFGEFLGFVMSALAIKQNNFYALLFSRLWTGFFAGNLTVCLAVFADTNTSTKSRSKGFGNLMMIGGLSFMAAIFVGGLFSNSDLFVYFTPATPFWITATLCIINLVIIKKFFYETTAPTKTHLLHCLARIFCKCQYMHVRKLYFVYFLFMFAWITTLQFLSPLLFTDYNVQPLAITATLFGMSLIWSITSGYLNRYLLTLTMPQKLLRITLLGLALCLILTNMPYRLWSIWVILAIASSAAALCWINILSLISKASEDTLQGKVLGLNQAVGALAMIAGPLLGSYLGSMNVHYIYLAGGIATLLAIPICLKK